MHEANALTKRIFKYVVCVTLLSSLFQITRFFEAKVRYDEVFDPSSNTTNEILILDPTEMRTHPIYTAYYNWSKLIVLGIIPFILLVFLNASIYKVNKEESCLFLKKYFVKNGRFPFLENFIKLEKYALWPSGFNSKTL